MYVKVVYKLNGSQTGHKHKHIRRTLHSITSHSNVLKIIVTSK